MKTNQITDLLKGWSNGDMKARDELMPLVDPELKKIARAYLHKERPGHILQTTALVNEALTRLLPKNVSYTNRRHFYGVVAWRMRRILIDYARKARRANYVGLDGVAISEQKSEEVIRLEEALTKLAATNERQATVVEYRHFIGLTRKDVAKLLDVSETTVDREWSEARKWLKHQMTGDAKI